MPKVTCCKTIVKRRTQARNFMGDVTRERNRTSTQRTPYHFRFGGGLTEDTGEDGVECYRCQWRSGAVFHDGASWAFPPDAPSTAPSVYIKTAYAKTSGLLGRRTNSTQAAVTWPNSNGRGQQNQGKDPFTVTDP